MLKQILRIYYLIWGSITHRKAVHFCKSGLWLWYKGDEILWMWTWKYAKLWANTSTNQLNIECNRVMTIPKSCIPKYCYVSLYASGNGEFGDTGFTSLKDIDDFWNQYQEACRR